MNTDEQQFKDEQELAKVLAGINDQLDKNSNNMGAVNKNTNQNNAAPKATAPVQTAATQTTPSAPVQEPASPMQPAQAPKAANASAPIQNPTPSPAAPQTNPVTPSTAMPAPSANQLDGVLHDALNDLRPLVDKLNVPIEEKFNTYLLLIRSTDDNNLIQPAYQTAKQITDDTKRAMALLDVIKEINYFTANKNTER